jgi:hypothetical protein
MGDNYEQSDESIARAIATLRNIISPPQRKKDANDGSDDGEDDFLARSRKQRKSGKGVDDDIAGNAASKTKKSNKEGRRTSAASTVVGYGTGDLFGTRGNYEKSLLYRSRLGSPTINTQKNANAFEKNAVFARVVTTHTKEDEQRKTKEKTFTSVFRAKEVANRKKSDMKSKRDCVNAINKWASNPDLHDNLLQFGIVEALSSMIEGDIDESVLTECVETVFQLSRNLDIRASLVRQELHLKVLDMITLAENLDSVTNIVNCCFVLLNFSDEPGMNDKFVRNGVVPTLNRLQATHPAILRSLLQIIFNMINKLERNAHWTQDLLYFDFVLLKMHSISAQDAALIMRTVSRAATLLEVPQQLCERDITGTLRTLLHRVSTWKEEYRNPVVKYIATTAYYVSKSVEASSKMVDAGGQGLIRDVLSNVENDDELTCIGIATLGNMARSRLVRSKLVNDGAVLLLCSIAERCSQQMQWLQTGVIKEAQFDFGNMLNMCVAALAMLSQDDESAVKVALQGGMKLLVIVATYAGEVTIRSEAIVALCNLLCSRELNKLYESVGDTVKSAIDVLVLYHKEILVHDIKIAGYFATVFNNMTLSARGREMTKTIAIADVIVWVALMAEGDDDAIELCLCCIYNCTVDSVLLKSFQTKKHIGAIIEIMKISKGTRVDELCIATLHKLASGFANAGKIFADEGAMDEIIDLTTSVAPRTRELAVTTLAQMTLDDDNIEILVGNGAIEALAEVAKSSDILAQRATAALSNIAGHKHGMYVTQLLDAGAVKTMIKLSGSKDPEVRRLSAHTICHLVSCATGPREEMIKAGAVNALVLTGLIRSSDEDLVTRKACCCAMYTLCSTGNIEELGDWRVVWSATCMLDLGKEFAIMAVTILANLSSYPSGRDVISNKQTIDGLVAVACGKSKVKVSSAVLKSVALIFHNVVCGYGRIKEQKKKKIRDVDNFEDESDGEDFGGDSDSDNDSEKNGDKKSFDGTNLGLLWQGKEGEHHKSACRIVAKCAGTKALSALARLEYPETREMCVAALATLCTLDDTHERFLKDGGFKTMNEVCQLNRFDLGTKCCWTIRHYCLICAVDAALRAGSRYQAVKDGALEMIVPIVESSKTSETDEHCCRCVELYAQDISARELMIDTGVIAAMDELTSGEDLDNSTLQNRVKRFSRTLLHVCSTDLKTRDRLVQYGAIPLIARFAKIPSESIAAEAIEALSLLCECEERVETIIYDGGLQIVKDVLSIGLKGEFGRESHNICERCSFIVGNFACNKDAMYTMIEEGLIPTVRFLSKSGSAEGIYACVKVVACACLVEEAINLMVELKQHKDIMIMYNRLMTQEGDYDNEIRLLALSLLNMTKTSDAIVQGDIMNTCDGALLLENAKQVSDADRDNIWHMLPHLPPSDDHGFGDDGGDEMIVPLFFSPAQRVGWPLYNFFTTPKQPDSAELKSKPQIAPRWKPKSNANGGDDSLETQIAKQLGHSEDPDNEDQVTLSSVPPVIDLVNSATIEFHEKISSYNISSKDAFVDYDMLDEWTTKKKSLQKLLEESKGGGTVTVDNKKSMAPSERQSYSVLSLDTAKVAIGGINLQLDAPQSYVDSLMEVVVDRMVEEPQRMLTIEQSKKQNAITRLEAKDSIAEANGAKRLSPLKGSPAPAFSIMGIPQKWASPSSPEQLRGLANSLGTGKHIDSEKRRQKAINFVEMMRKKSQLSVASDKRQLVVSLASTLESLKMGTSPIRRARTSPSTRRSSNNNSPSTSSVLPDIRRPSSNGGKDEFSRIKIASTGRSPGTKKRLSKSSSKKK